MAEIIRGGGKEPRKHNEEQYGGSHYQRQYVKDYRHEPMKTRSRHYVSRQAELSGGTHRKEFKSFNPADFVAFHGDHIGLIHIAALIPHRRKHKRRR